MSTWYPGFLPLAAGRRVLLEPRECGVLKVGRGTLAVGDRLLGAGETLKLWHGDGVQAVNAAGRTTAFFAWDACAGQPTFPQRVRRLLARAAARLNPRRGARLAPCGDRSWCVRA